MCQSPRGASIAPESVQVAGRRPITADTPQCLTATIPGHPEEINKW